jgi:DNA-binding transcriptional regulator YhcF (GntR family)
MICIEKNVFDEKELTPAAKLFHGYLKTSNQLELSNNKYAEKFGVSTMTINNWLSALEHQNFIEILYFKKTRKIKIIK